MVALRRSSILGSGVVVGPRAGGWAGSGAWILHEWEGGSDKAGREVEEMASPYVYSSKTAELLGINYQRNGLLDS